MKIKYYNAKNLIVQHLAVTESGSKIEINRMRNGYFIQTSTTVDFQDFVKICCKVIEIYEGVIYRENFKMSLFKNVIDIIFELRRKFKKKENYDVMQLLVKMIKNSLYGELARKDISESYDCKSENWMISEYDERVLDYQKIKFGNCILKMKNGDGLEDENKKVNNLPLQLAAFVLSNSKRIMKSFVLAIDRLYTNDLYYEDTDSMYIEKKHWEKLDKAGLVGKNRLQCKDDYKRYLVCSLFSSKIKKLFNYI